MKKFIIPVIALIPVLYICSILTANAVSLPEELQKSSNIIENGNRYDGGIVFKIRLDDESCGLKQIDDKTYELQMKGQPGHYSLQLVDQDGKEHLSVYDFEIL